MKREPKNPNDTLALCVTRGRCSERQLKVTIKLCTIGERDNSGKRYPYSPDECDGLTIRDLGYQAYWSDYEGGYLMTGDLAYTDSVTTLNERRVERLLKTIRTVNRKLAKVREAVGCARPADEQLAHLALALGISTVFVYDRDRNGGEWSCSDVAYARGCIAEWAQFEKVSREERRVAGGM